MIEIKKKTDCCGCTACFNICPAKAITMDADEEGFLYPAVDRQKCVECGLCEKYALSGTKSVMRRIRKVILSGIKMKKLSGRAHPEERLLLLPAVF